MPDRDRGSNTGQRTEYWWNNLLHLLRWVFTLWAPTPNQASLTTMFPSLAASLKGVRPREFGTISRGTDWSSSASRARIRSMAWHAIVLLGCRTKMWSTVLPRQTQAIQGGDKIREMGKLEEKTVMIKNIILIYKMLLCSPARRIISYHGNPGPWC